MKLNFIKTIYNGIDLRRFPFSDRKGNYLVWLGKINKLKGTKEAILASKKSDMRIYLMGVIERGVPEMLAYYENEIKPLIDDRQVIWVGEVSHNEKTSILSGAKAFLNPIQWEEPFGLVMIESQAVGTPVISYKRGAAAEVIVDGKTGFLVETLDEMKEAITEVEQLQRSACRQNVEENFTIKKMVEGYESAYRTVIENWERYKKEQLKMINKGL
jgi:glycosyltransferase involved in cell wall biosynthesis